MPFVPRRDEHPIGFGFHGFVPKHAIHLSVQAVRLQAGLADFRVVVTGDDRGAGD